MWRFKKIFKKRQILKRLEQQLKENTDTLSALIFYANVDLKRSALFDMLKPKRNALHNAIRRIKNLK